MSNTSDLYTCRVMLSQVRDQYHREMEHQEILEKNLAFAIAHNIKASIKLLRQAIAHSKEYAVALDRIRQELSPLQSK